MSDDSTHAVPSVNLPTTESHGGNRSPRDQAIWDRIENVVEANGHPLRHVLELFPAYIRHYQLKRFLAHFELFKNVVELPGVIIEVGVYRGVSLLTWSKLLEIYNPSDRAKRVYGFDSFKGLQDFDEKDGKMEPAAGKVQSGWSAEKVKDEVTELLRITNDDNLIPGIKRVELVEGDIFETLPRFLKDNPGTRICLLHMDVDLYKPTKFAFELLYPLVVKGGVIVFDEYGLVPWEGESNAVDEYFKSIGEAPTIKRFPFTHLPSGYMIK